MALCISWLRHCFEGVGPTRTFNTIKEQPLVILDTYKMGQDAVIVKNGRRLCGSGAALATAPILQDKAYFEVKIQQTGVWGVGLASPRVNLNSVPLGKDGDSWVLRSDGVILHAGETVSKLSEVPAEGDILGVSYDHVELNFYLNGKNLQCPVTSARGELYPRCIRIVLHLDEGAILDAEFTTFQHSPPPGFDKILLEKSLL
ncbi:SPRYD7 [Cordylochernes scorpioides]|uniref:SPRY domain-containing protein 7 n=1 Tax=Cordylochernes scorpioides TaxID=51811 RepID=A0ABY6KUZ6_9ARAC|nr:SPRYD7 [Cordylochernes scorpioides]